MLTISTGRSYTLATPNSVGLVTGTIEYISSVDPYFALLADENTGAVYGINLNDVSVNGQMLSSTDELIAIFEASNGDTQ